MPEAHPRDPNLAHLGCGLGMTFLKKLSTDSNLQHSLRTNAVNINILVMLHQMMGSYAMLSSITSIKKVNKAINALKVYTLIRHIFK